MRRIAKKLERIGAWWNGQSTAAPLLNVRVSRRASAVELNRHWPAPESAPDFETLVAGQMENLAAYEHLAESYPVLPHEWGSRGTPMTMAAYLGGKVVFGEDTVWIEPSIKDWEDFEIAFHEGNHWVAMSRKLMETQLRKTDGDLLIWLPDLGDALTVLSLLRGVERLCMDLIERPEVIKGKMRDFTKAWMEAHRYFWSLYRRKLPGDCTCALWAPGKTNVCQCDFSTMISPEMFREFVVPEIEDYARYLDYIIWHLDGPDEIKHLDALLEIPAIRAYDIVPAEGGPPCASPLWLPQMRKIQEKGKLLWACAADEKEVDVLLSALSPDGLFLDCGVFSSRDRAARLIEQVKGQAG